MISRIAVGHVTRPSDAIGLSNAIAEATHTLAVGGATCIRTVGFACRPVEVITRCAIRGDTRSFAAVRICNRAPKTVLCDTGVACCTFGLGIRNTRFLVTADMCVVRAIRYNAVTTR